MCLAGNFVGGLVFAVMYHFSTLVEGPTGEQALHSVEAKLGYLSSASGVADLFVRAILCNFMINLAMLLIYNGFIHDDWSKIVSMIVAVFVFAFLGFEHSVANTVLFTVVGLTHGIDVLAASGNVAVAKMCAGVASTAGILLNGRVRSAVQSPERCRFSRTASPDSEPSLSGLQ